MRYNFLIGFEVHNTVLLSIYGHNAYNREQLLGGSRLYLAPWQFFLPQSLNIPQSPSQRRSSA